MDAVKKMYIDGKWVEAASGKTRTLINPANGQPMAVVANGGAAEAKAALDAAARAFEPGSEWRQLSVMDRAELLRKTASLLEERMDELARTECLNTGRLHRETQCDDVYAAIGAFQYCAETAASVFGQTATNVPGLLTMTLREPLGVCGVLSPWNFPIGTAANQIAPALAAGNPIVVKPASITPLTAILLFEVFEQAGFPAGSVNLVLGPGAEVGDTIVADPRVSMIVFTGGTDTGKEIIRNSASSVKRFSLELGGKSPAILFDDADLDVAIDNILYNIFLSQGQMCTAGSRLLVQSTIYDKVVAEIARRAEKVKIGMPFDMEAEFGPMVSEEQMNHVLACIESGVQEGARLVAGGSRITEGDFGKGFFVRPTVFADCDNSMKIVQEEIFGPVLTIQSFTDEAEAIALANHTRFGLAGAVFTQDVGKALRVCSAVRTGVLWVNTVMESDYLPVSPQRESGTGTVGGLAGLEEYTALKQVCISLEPKKKGWFAD